MKPQLAAPWIEIHRRALLEGRITYVDPQTGLSVFTELFHERRGHCCESSCRHCPWRNEQCAAEGGGKDVPFRKLANG